MEGDRIDGEQQTFFLIVGVLTFIVVFTKMTTFSSLGIGLQNTLRMNFWAHFGQVKKKKRFKGE